MDISMPQYTYMFQKNIFVYNLQKVFQAIKRIHLDAQLDSMLNSISNFFWNDYAILLASIHRLLSWQIFIDFILNYLAFCLLLLALVTTSFRTQFENRYQHDDHHQQPHSRG